MFDSKYKNTLLDIKNNGFIDINNRTGAVVASLPGITFKIDLEKDGFPLLGLRKMYFSFVPEIMWMLSGIKSIDWLEKFTKIWSSFSESDNTIKNSYGYRWKYHFGVDQIFEVLNKLKKDPSSRQGVVLFWSPNDDLIPNQKNVPCPIVFTLMILDNKLHLHIMFRSNDMILGFPTDIAGFALLQYIFAQELNIGVGILTHTISNAHIYATQYEVLNELISRPLSTKKVEFILPDNCLQRAMNLDETLINEIKNNFKNYNPQPAIKNITITI